MTDSSATSNSIESPPGERQGLERRFTAREIAMAFAVDERRVARALAGEFGYAVDEAVDSKQAQQLAEVILGDQPIDRRLAALMHLGAYVPRSDADWGLGDAPGGVESDLLAARADVPPTELAATRSSHDPATQPVD
jgi:hypothetical protein